MFHHVYVFHSNDMRDWKASNRTYVARLALSIPIMVEVEDILELAFQKSNSIDNYWIENPEVAYVSGDKHRSTSVGDMFVLSDGRKFVVDVFGFKEVTEIDA